MKNRRLPETDIANLAFLPATLKMQRLAAWLRPRQAKGSYDPYRRTSADAVNQQLPLYAEGQILTPWNKLEGLIKDRCRGDELLLSMNIPVAKATHDFSLENDLSAEPIPVGSLTLSEGQRYEFGPNLVLYYDDGVSAMFPDLRRTGNLSQNGRRVAYSMMHQRLRVNYPEYAELRLETWRYRNNDTRSIEVFRHTDELLYSYEELSQDFAETYRIMNELRAGDEVAQRRNRGNDLGPLFGFGS